VDVEAHLEQLDQLVAEGRPVPLSGLVLVNRHDAEDLVAEARAALPEDLRQARWILKERDELLEAGAREADAVRADARAEAERLVSETEVVRAARREAERVLAEADERSRVLRLEAEDYVDAKLANFSEVLDRAMDEVERGRERLRQGLGTSDGAVVSTSAPHRVLPDDGAAVRHGGAAPAGGYLFDQERAQD